MPLIRPGDARVHRLHGAEFTGFANSATGAAELRAWQLDVPGGTEGAEHTVTREEVFLILDGEPALTIDGRAERLAPGDVALVPALSRIRLDNPGDAPARMWVTASAGLAAVMADGSLIRPPWAA
ncbi:cupin domain-containing protein [Nocardiopsis suaedae]|uniref:Cupin domain-containing protein n=1 Tax=Nocardiopsis suaedae TaxID=3018444 RepID=A0ABT4TLT1_9ACTN|nr:cupin domain-containing protein [Nocardiopsis suaedae]MDA2805659.1 cupin domain-containing protein [Nocardiopsis suaedae]